MRNAESLAGKSILITAGPTREAIDPVRFISNRSSGKMGFAVAQAAAEAGANVILVAGPVALETPPRVRRVDVESAEDMMQAVHARICDTDVFIAAAAVADYRPDRTVLHKIKKNDQRMRLDLVRNPDILASVAGLSDPPFTVGFAAETTDLVAHARDKLERKGLHMIAANKVGPGLAFDQDDNELLLIWRDGQHALPLQDKLGLARALIECIAERFALQQDADAAT